VTHEWVLPDDMSAARVARSLVERSLASMGVTGESRDDAVLIASELAANGVRHGEPPVTLRLATHDDRLRITVANHGASPDPRILTADPDAEHGRGLAMVEALAAEVGWDRDADRLDVWADIVLP
jgi:serine/threonine-protein kinase RsbW